MTVLVLGSSGQIATHLRELEPQATFWGRQTLDISDTERLEQAIVAAAPSVVINAAAYTAVDRAEAEPAAAWRLNAEAAAAAARGAARLGAALVHFSTDYVFDGAAAQPYGASASPRPLSAYGRTKLAGELATATLCRHHYILRTSWVFSEHGANFVRTMLRLVAQNDTLRIVADQIGRPTYAGDLARLALSIVRDHAGAQVLSPGTYHAVGGPIVSWHGFAQRIFARAHELGMLDRVPQVVPIETKDYPTPAQRPLRAVLEPSPELATILEVAIDWEAGLDRALAKLAEAARAAPAA